MLLRMPVGDLRDGRVSKPLSFKVGAFTQRVPMQPGARDKHAVTLADGDVHPIRFKRGRRAPAARTPRTQRVRFRTPIRRVT